MCNALLELMNVNSEKIAARGTTNLAESLQGSVPGEAFGSVGIFRDLLL